MAAGVTHPPVTSPTWRESLESPICGRTGGQTDTLVHAPPPNPTPTLPHLFGTQPPSWQLPLLGLDYFLLSISYHPPPCRPQRQAISLSSLRHGPHMPPAAPMACLPEGAPNFSSCSTMSQDLTQAALEEVLLGLGNPPLRGGGHWVGWLVGLVLKILAPPHEGYSRPPRLLSAAAAPIIAGRAGSLLHIGSLIHPPLQSSKAGRSTHPPHNMDPHAAGFTIHNKSLPCSVILPG